jgi:hypothetical protein
LLRSPQSKSSEVGEVGKLGGEPRSRRRPLISLMTSKSEISLKVWAGLLAVSQERIGKRFSQDENNGPHEN